MRPHTQLGPTAIALALAACGPVTPAPHELPPPPLPTVPSPPLAPEAPPLGRLPSDVHVTRYKLELRIDPARPRFEGTADIEIVLDRPRDVVWLHGRDLAVHAVSLVSEGAPAPAVEARWDQASAGVAGVRLPSAAGPGRFSLHVAYDAPLGTNDEGVFVKERGSERYVFTQFEATYARRAFPGFDEPAFKVPFALSLVVPRGLVAVGNTREVSRGPDARDPAWDRVELAPTPPLPSYLLAFAVGPLDVVQAPDVPPGGPRARGLPLRGVATRGRGPELAYALAHTPALVAALEAYFGSEFPYEKLDLVAVPDMNGAMEDAGFVTFGEGLLMIDERTVTVEQRFAFNSVAGHELAHQWFGDLVTMPWWDDVWLNEGFATWMRAAGRRARGARARPGGPRAARGVHEAMGADSLVTARKIRQEIADDNDIDSAFDAITYDKGGSVLAMFERWMGPAVFQEGRARLPRRAPERPRHRRRPARGPRRGVGARRRRPLPHLPRSAGPAVRRGAPRLRGRAAARRRAVALPPRRIVRRRRRPQVEDPRVRPLRRWSERREACALLEDREGSIPLPGRGCPAWVMPNADAAGYYRWSLAPADGKRLAQAAGLLGERERMSFAESLGAAFARASMPVGDVLDALAPLAADPSYAVARTPMSLLSTLGRWLETGPAHAGFERYAASLYAPVLRGLGWEPKKGEDPGRTVLRRTVIAFLALTARDAGVRREAAARGRAWLGFGKDGKIHPEAVSPELVGVSLRVAAADGGARFFDALVAALAAEKREEGSGRRIVATADRQRDGPRAGRARPGTRAVAPPARQRDHAHPLVPDGAARDARPRLVRLHEEPRRAPRAHAQRVGGGRRAARDQLLRPRARRRDPEGLRPAHRQYSRAVRRALAGALEEVSLCVARRAAHEAGARAFFEKRKR